MNDLYICRQCSSIATPREERRGSYPVEKILWCLLLVPGALYSAWRRVKKEKACPVCSSREIILLNSPKGIRFMNGMYSNRNTRFVHKVLDYTERDFARPGHVSHEGRDQGMAS